MVQQVQEEHPQKQVEIWFQVSRGDSLWRDEARFGQQGTLTHVWAEKGSRPTAVKQTEYEWAYVYAAVNPITGASSAIVGPTVNTDYMNEHLRMISEEAGQNKHVVPVLDQAGWHVSETLKVPENITLLHLPPYSPELNPIERLWLYLKSHYLSNRVFADYDDLFDCCRDAWKVISEADFRSICHTSGATLMGLIQ